MKTNIEKRAKVMNKKHIFNSRWKKVVGVLACIAVFWTTYALILPAITVSTDTFCGYEEHVHTDACYERIPVCGLEESEGDPEAEPVLISEGHVHTEVCYSEGPHLVCGLEEGPAVTAHTHDETCYTEEARLACGLEEEPEVLAHTHGEACYTEETHLVCGLEENEEHTHSEGCYETVSVLTCGLEETEGRPGHAHTEACYVTESVLTCQLPESEGRPEHVHSEACYEEGSVLVCGLEESEPVYETPEAGHVHTDDCYITVLTCGKEEHTHSQQCYSDKNADVETASVWETTLPDAEAYTGVWAEDVITIAKSQLGYTESTKNFYYTNGERKGYTRYGAMQGVPYGDWCAMFLQFCLHYAGVDSNLFPSSPSCQTWADQVAALDNFHTPESGYEPQAGDIVFFDFNLEGETHHVGLVTELSYTTELDHETGENVERLTGFTTIEGNASNKVKYVSYQLDDNHIYGYSVIPERPLTEEELAALADVLDAESGQEEGAEDADDESVRKEDADADDTEELRAVKLASVTESGVRVDFSAPVEAFGEDVDIASLWLQVEELDEDHSEYDSYVENADASLGEFTGVKNIRLFDICVMDADSNEVRLTDESLASVRMTFPDGNILGEDEDAELSVVHFAEAGTEMLEAAKENEVLSFETPGFSVFGVMETVVITERIITASGDVYEVSVAYTEEAQIPEGATLSLTEFPEDSPEHERVKAIYDEKRSQKRDEEIEAMVQSALAEIEEAKAADSTLSSDGFLSEEALRKKMALEYDASHAEGYFALIDICIIDPDGREIEPMAPVTVRILLESLPEGANASDVAASLNVNHIVEENGQLVAETVADAETNEGVVEVVAETEESFFATAEFATDSFSYYTIAFDNANNADSNRITVYYGFELDGEFHEFGDYVATPANGSNNQTGADREFHINTASFGVNDTRYFNENVYENYTYQKAYLKRGDTVYELANGPLGADPVIYGTATGLKVSAKQAGTNTYSDIVLTNLDEIFVVYESPHKKGIDYNYVNPKDKNDDTIGGEAYRDDLDLDDVDLGEPAHTKTLSENTSEKTGLFDNTYELTLTVTAKSKSKAANTKVDVLIVMDRSGSVSGNGFAENSVSAIKYLVSALDDVERRYGSDAVKYSYIYFNTYAHTPIHYDKNTGSPQSRFETTGNEMVKQYGILDTNCWGSGYTNWEDALRAVVEMPVRDDAQQFVIFLTDGNPTVRNTRMTEEMRKLYESGSDSNYLTRYGYRSSALGEWYYSIKDGTWTQIDGYDPEVHAVYGLGTDDNPSDILINRLAAQAYAKAIVDSGMDLYAIGWNNGYDLYELEPIMRYAYGQADTEAAKQTYLTNDEAGIKAAFNDLIEAINKNFEYEFIQINDGLSATTETTLVDTPRDFRYYKYRTLNELPEEMPEGFSVIVDAVTPGERVTVDETMWNNMRSKGNAPYYFPGRTKQELLEIIWNAKDENGNYYIPNHDEYITKDWSEMTLAEKEPYKWEYDYDWEELPVEKPSYISDAEITDSTWYEWRVNGVAPEDPNATPRELYHLCWEKLNAADKEKYLPYPAATMTDTEKAAYPKAQKPVPEATYNEETGQVEWDLVGMTPEDGYTYAVAFTVYPNQDGWDKITDLKNHADDPDFDWYSIGVEKVVNADGSTDLFEVEYDETTETYKRTSKKPLLSLDADNNVKIASNDNASLIYRQVNTTVDEDGRINRELTPEKEATYVTPYMSVEPSSINLRKIWKDTLVPRWSIDEVDLEIWYVSRGDVGPITETYTDEETGETFTVTYWKDSATGDHTDKSEIAYVDDDGTIWYWAAKYEDVCMKTPDDLSGYINIHVPQIYEDLTVTPATAPTKITKAQFEALQRASSGGLHVDSENYLMNGDQKVQATITLGDGTTRTYDVQYFAYWELDSSIAPGLVATNIKPDGTPLTGAEGHYYAFREMDTSVNQDEEFRQHFELDSTVVRPMKRDGVVDENAKMLTGTNSRKGELAVTKMALTQDRHEINPDVPFQVTVTFTDSNGKPLMQDTVTGTDEDGQPIIVQEHRTDLEYVVYDADGNVVDIDSITGSTEGAYTIGITSAQIEGGAATGDYHKLVPYVGDDETGYHQLVFSRLYPDWTVVFVNLPSGAKWTIQETYNTDPTYSNGYIFEGYTLPTEKRGHETLHPQPHFISDLHHYSGGTVTYDSSGNIVETNLNAISDFEQDPLNALDDKGNRIAQDNGAAANSISGYVDADAEELVDIHNTRTADDMEIRKTDADTGEGLEGAKFVIESYRPVTQWRIHTDEETGTKEWREIYVFGSNPDDPDSPDMTEAIGPAHYPAEVHIHGGDRYVVRGDVFGVLYAMPRNTWVDDYTPRPLDRDGNEITNVSWVTVPAGQDLTGLTSGVHYINQGGTNYILRPSTSETGKYEKIPDTTQTHVYYYVESNADGLLVDTDPNHAEFLKELPIIAGDSITYFMYEVEAPEGYMTILQQMQETNPAATIDDAKFELLVTTDREWNAEQNASVPYIRFKDPRTGQLRTVYGEWDADDHHWDFNFSIDDKRGYFEVELKKIQSNIEVVNTPKAEEVAFYAMKPASGDPSALGLFEKNEEDRYLPTTDTTVDSAKTYYIGLIPITRESTADATVNPQANGWIKHLDLFGAAYPNSPLITRSDIPITTDTTKGANTSYYRQVTKVTYDGDTIDDEDTPGMSGIKFTLAIPYTYGGGGSPVNYGAGGTPHSDLGEIEGYFNILAEKLHAMGDWTVGKTEILTVGYEAAVAAGRIDSEGYLLTEDKSARLTDNHGQLVKYAPRYISNGVRLVAASNKDGELLIDKVTDSDGRINFGKLPNGTYWLFEETPMGYTTAKPMKIIVSGDGVTYAAEDEDGGRTKDASYYTKTTDQGSGKILTNVYEVVRKNTPEDLTLPHTGGFGTQWIYLSGLLLILSSSLIYVTLWARRRKEVAHRERPSPAGRRRGGPRKTPL